MAKERSKQINKTFVYFSIISSISKSGKLPTDLPKQNYTRFIRTLKINGLIHYKGYATWEITPLGKQTIDLKEVNNTNLDALVQPYTFNFQKCKKQTTRFVRSHGFMWKVHLRNKVNKDQLLKTLANYTPILTKTKMIQITLWDHNIKIGNKAIIINFDKNTYFKTTTAKQGYEIAVYELKRILLRLENIAKLPISQKGKYLFKPCKKHFGNVNNEIAKEYKKLKATVSISDNGKEWLVIDFSDKQFIEMETTDNSQNIIDNDHIIAPFMNKLRHSPKILEELESNQIRLMKIIEDQQKVMAHLLEKDERSVNLQRFL